MHKVYALYREHSGEYDYCGIFSSEWRAEEAVRLFSPLVVYGELYIEEFEIDELEKYYDKARTKNRLWLFWGRCSEFSGKRIVSWMSINPAEFDFLFLEEREDFLYTFNGHVNASIKSKTKEEAEEKANNMFDKLGEDTFVYG